MSRVDLLLSFLSSRKKKKRQTKNNANIANVLIILRHLTKLHAFIGKVKMRYESLRNVAMHFKAFKCLKNAFLSSAVVTLLLFELRMCVAMTLISTVTQLEKDKTALADQYT